jgi:hypothetical protein
MGSPVAQGNSLGGPRRARTDDRRIKRAISTRSAWPRSTKSRLVPTGSLTLRPIRFGGCVPQMCHSDSPALRSSSSLSPPEGARGNPAVRRGGVERPLPRDVRARPSAQIGLAPERLQRASHSDRPCGHSPAGQGGCSGVVPVSSSKVSARSPQLRLASKWLCGSSPSPGRSPQQRSRSCAAPT